MLLWHWDFHVNPLDMPTPIIKKCVNALIERNFTIAFAESATAGRAASDFALTKNSGQILLGGVVCYNESTKCHVLNIPKQFIDKYTAESAEVTRAMAENTTTLFKADIIAAITGLASPGGSETPEKPVGTMFIHVLSPFGYVSHRELFIGEPEDVVSQTITRTCDLILDVLAIHPPTP